MPKDVIGIILERQVEKKANKLVTEVAIMAEVAFLKVNDSCFT
jgi:hypothetical protein